MTEEKTSIIKIITKEPHNVSTVEVDILFDSYVRMVNIKARKYTYINLPGMDGYYHKDQIKSFHLKKSDFDEEQED